MKIRTLHAEQWLPLPVEQVFDFFADARNLDALTPPWLHFRILTAGPIEMKVGALIDYRLTVRWLPIYWRTEITEWSPPFHFVDEQIKGPYKLWRHRHTFEAKDDGTLIRDQIDYAVPGWFLEPLAHWLFVGPDLRKIFAYRKARIEDLLVAPDYRFSASSKNANTSGKAC